MGPLARAGRRDRRRRPRGDHDAPASRERIVALFALSVVVDVVCGVLIFLFERHARGTDIKTIGSGLFFSSAQHY